MDSRYICNSKDNESIPEEVLRKLKLTFKEVHQDSNKMASLSKAIKEHNRDTICRVPFSNTIEAESLGSNIKFPGENIQAMIDSYKINRIEDIYKLNKMDFNHKSMAETLKAVELLKSQGERVCIQIEGPFTIATQIMDSTLFYKSLLKEAVAMDHLLNIIKAGILEYIETAITKGAEVISYADPAGTIELVGPRMYKNYSGSLNSSILKKAEAIIGDSIIHICGRTSSSLEIGGFAKGSLIQVSEGMSYGESVFEIIEKQKEVKIIGNGCIKISHLKNNKNCLWRMDLI
ncbi:MAG: uroporphyrinogen decarboxylase family protein [Solirubrobacterales bacterium]